MLLALGFVGIYVVLVGAASFATKLISRDLDPFQLDAAMRIGGVVLAVAALVAAHGLTVPGPLPALAGLGIGVLAGAGALFYCLSLTSLPVWLVASLANAYILVTVVLGVVVLGEPVTVLKVVGVALTLAGMVLLSYHSHGGRKGVGRRAFLRSLAFLLPYIALIGTSAFLEKPALSHLDPLQLNALTAIGMVAVGVAAALIRDRGLPLRRPGWLGAGIGATIALANIFYYLGLAHLAVSVAATIANSYILVTVLLSVLVLHDSITKEKVAGMAVILLGVTLLALH